MPTTYEAIATVTVGAGGASTIDFTSIPQTYTDLVAKLSARQNNTSGTMNLRFNNSSSNYSFRTLYGTGSAAGSQSSSGVSQIGPGSSAGNVNWSSTTANTFSNFEIYIPNYTSSSHKSASIDVVTENNATLSYQLMEAVLWADTSAINRITFIPSNAESFVQYTTATLYGIKKD